MIQNSWGGARLGAGRKPKLENQTIEQVKRYSASTLLKMFRDPSTDKDMLAEIAIKVFIKAMPTTINSDGTLAPKTIVLMRNEKALDKVNEDAKIEVLPTQGENVTS